MSHHAYEKPGIYKMKATATEDHGGKAKCTWIFRVLKNF
jgi:PKD repeat protein